jgi:hypothetical protein
MRKVLTVSLVCLLSLSCKKDKKYSQWVVNGESFATNDVEVSEGKQSSVLSSKDQDYRFSIAFGSLGILPTSNSFLLSHFTENDPSFVKVSFYYHGKTYIPALSNNEKLTASNADGPRLTLPESWFSSYNDKTDSVLIHGTFNEP